jgi:hypothetical protein
VLDRDSSEADDPNKGANNGGADKAAAEGVPRPGRAAEEGSEVGVGVELDERPL